MWKGKKKRFRAVITDMPEGDPAPGKLVSYKTQVSGVEKPWERDLGKFLGDFNGEHRIFEPFDAEVLKESLKKDLDHWLLKPGPFAHDSIPASGRTNTKADRDNIQPLGEKNGCHHGGKDDKLGSNGKYIADHMPPSGLVEYGLADESQVLYPQCEAHSNKQSAIVNWIVGVWTGRYHMEED
jgi:hypothetical protein